MTMSRAILLLLVVSLACAAVCTAFRLDDRQRCLCMTAYKVMPHKIMSLEVHRSSASCSKDEIVVTLRNRKKVCLHPNTKLWQFLMQQVKGSM